MTTGNFLGEYQEGFSPNVRRVLHFDHRIVVETFGPGPMTIGDFSFAIRLDSFLPMDISVVTGERLFSVRKYE